MAGAYRFIQHFSHPHPLELSTFQSPQGLTNPPTLCSCCELAPSGQIWICRPCNFMLHLCCSQLPNSITHPAHCNHTLTLLSTAAYRTGQFSCNACRKPGKGFNYHCSHCSYDLHPICAHLPFNFTHQSHACPLSLTFGAPFANTTGMLFFCNICGMFIGSNEWHYRCNACNFDVHLSCCRNMANPERGVVGPRRPTGLGTALAKRIFEVIGLPIVYTVGQAIVGYAIGGDQGTYNPGYDFLDSSSIWDSLISVFGF